MEKFKVHKKIGVVMLAIFALIFCTVTFSFFNVNISNAQNSVEDFDAFQSALFEMVEYNEKQIEEKNSSQIMLLSADDEDDKTEEEIPSTNRLIVYSSEKLNSQGAVAKAKYKDLQIFQFESLTDAQKAYDYFSSLNTVDDVSFDEKVYAEDIEVAEEEISATASSYASWGANYLGYSDYMSTLTESNTEVKEVVVAVLDSGIYTSHVWFQGRILHNYADNFTTETSTTAYTYEDRNGHGTHVAGIIANATPSNVKILPLKVLDKEGEGYVSYITSAIFRVETYVSQGLDVKLINMSIGIKKSSGSTTNSSLANRINSAYDKGVLSIVSAGNDKLNTLYCAPANVDSAVTVSALCRSSNSIVFDSSYSNYGSHVDFSAPGTSIQSAGIDYSTKTDRLMSGTSMAAPHVTACYALVYMNENYYNFTPAQMNELMQANAIDLGATGKDDYYGYGCINVANIGIANRGYVTFTRSDGVDGEHATSSFQLELTYDKSLIPSNFGECSVKIYYNTDDSTLKVDREKDSFYSSTLYVSGTVKINACAFVYNANGVLIQKSNVTSKIYYFNNYDLVSNYEYEIGTYLNEVTITKYNGKLTTLNVPLKLGGKYVTGINYRAFNSSDVEILYLPSTIGTIYTSAFYNNTVIKEIYCPSSDVEVGASAFRYSSIEKIQFSTEVALPIFCATSLGDYAFANCSALEEIYLPEVVSIGQHALSASSIKTIMIGQKISTIKNQTNLSLTKIYGYDATVAKSSLADLYNIDFVDLTMRISDDFNTRKIVATGNDVVLDLNITGFSMHFVTTFSGNESSFGYLSTALGDFTYNLKVTLSDLAVGEYTLSISFEDYYTNVVTSKTCSIFVVSADAPTFSVNYDEGNFDVYVNGELISASTTLFQGFDYEVLVVAKEGYTLSQIQINGQTQSTSKSFVIQKVDKDQDIVVMTREDESFSVRFDIDSTEGKVWISEMSVGSFVVARGESLSFAVEPAQGYRINSVSVDGEVLSANESGKYVLENVLSDKIVTIEFEQPKYTISITQGNGGSYSISGASGNVVDFGSTIVLHLSSSDGYKIKSVLVNGKEVELVDGTLTLENIEQDYEVVIICDQETASLMANSVVVRYLIVFVALFIVFILARVILYFARKEKNQASTF